MIYITVRHETKGRKPNHFVIFRASSWTCLAASDTMVAAGTAEDRMIIVWSADTATVIAALPGNQVMASSCLVFYFTFLLNRWLQKQRDKQKKHGGYFYDCEGISESLIALLFLKLWRILLKLSFLIPPTRSLKSRHERGFQL